MIFISQDGIFCIRLRLLTAVCIESVSNIFAFICIFQSRCRSDRPLNTGWATLQLVFDSRKPESFLFPQVEHTDSGTHLASYSFGTGGSCLGACSGHITIYNTEDKNAWSYTTTPPYVYMAHTGTNFTLPLPVYPFSIFRTTYLVTYLLHGAESYLRS